MSEHLRDRLHQEMSAQLPPPDRDLVAGAVSSGLRTRRLRRTVSGAGTFAVVGLTALAVTMASHYAVAEDTSDKTHVSAHLTNAGGKTGMLQFSLEHDTLGHDGDCVQPAPNNITCHPTGDGGYAIVANDHAGCVNTADLNFVH